MSGVVVTGAASGIGRASAEALIADGRRVALWDIAPAVAEVADELGMPHAVLDVCDGAALRAAVDAAAGALDGIDGLVHAAGRVIAEPVGAYTEESWDAVLDVNLRAQAVLAQLLLPYLQAAAQAGAGPAIVGISSIEGLTANPFIPAYCASKAGLLGLTRSMAAQLGPEGIRVNAVCPGFSRTDGPARQSRGGGRGGRLPDVSQGVLRHRHPTGRRRGSDLPSPLTRAGQMVPATRDVGP